MARKKINPLRIVLPVLLILGALSFLVMRHRLFSKTVMSKKASVAAAAGISAKNPPREVKSGESADKETFLEAAPITFHADKYREFPIPDGDVSGLKVSPTGQAVVFVKKTHGTTRLEIVDLTSGGIATVDSTLKGYADPSWSADGS
jgi:hypothetical protein